MQENLILASNSFIWLSNDTGLIYNTDTAGVYEFPLSASIRKLCDHFLNYDNMYSIVVDRDISDCDVREFIDNIMVNKLGFVTDVGQQFISLPPILNILNDYDRIKNSQGRDGYERVLKYLSSITLYIGGDIKWNQTYYKQTAYPIASEHKADVHKFLQFLKRARSKYLSKLNIVLSSINDLELIIPITDLSTQSAIPTNIYIHCHDIYKAALKEVLTVSDVISVVLIMESNIPEAAIREIVQTYQNGVGYNFLIKSEQDYSLFSCLISDYGVASYNLIPIYDDNFDFFEKNIFLTKEEIIAIKPSKREVFINQTLNSNFFGYLHLFPDGKVYANVNCKPIGALDDSVYDIIVNELEQNTAWRVTRGQLSGRCGKCLYRYFCPPISNYELITAKMDHCK